MIVKTLANYATTGATFPASVVPAKVELTSMTTEVNPLATQRISLEWRPIMGWYQHSELKMYDYITVRERSTRQTLFEDIKYSHFGDHTFYQGGWGPEPMNWSVNTEQGYVWCTEARHQEIEEWVLE